MFDPINLSKMSIDRKEKDGLTIRAITILTDLAAKIAILPNLANNRSLNPHPNYQIINYQLSINSMSNPLSITNDKNATKFLK